MWNQGKEKEKRKSYYDQIIIGFFYNNNNQKKTTTPSLDTLSPSKAAFDFEIGKHDVGRRRSATKVPLVKYPSKLSSKSKAELQKIGNFAAI